jgi:FkbM family methyltransferase
MMSFIDRYFIKQPRLRRLITRLFEGDREVDVSVLGTKLHVHSVKEHGYLRSARLAGKSALLREETPVLLNLAALLADGDTFVDIGANVGIYSLTLARMRRFLPRTNFYAFEANPDTYSRLAVHANALGVRTRNIALSDKNGALEFVGGAVSHVFTTVENASDYSLPGERVTVASKRLDDCEIEGDSLILKIDVEGQEKNVLDGAAGFFAGRRIKAVYLDGYKDRAVETLLAGHGFRLYEGKTLEPTSGCVFSLLALYERNTK